MTTVVLLLMSAICALYLFTGVFDYFVPKGKTSGVLVNEETGADTAYSLEILSYENIDSELVKEWVDSKKDSPDMNGIPIYHTLYHNDFEAPMEMYLFMPLAQDLFGDISLSNIRVSESGQAILIYVETKPSITRKKASYDLIMRVFVSGHKEEASARTERLYINGEFYYSPGATFSDLK